MTTITLKSLEPKIAQRLQQRANESGRTIEAEIAEILSDVLISEKQAEKTVGLATAIRQRFSPVGGFELPEIPREPIRTPPSF